MSNKEKIAKNKVDELLANPPGAYSSPYADRADEALAAIQARQTFSYDPGADPSYMQYKRSYADAGRAAMADTQVQAAALSGGYLNSYASTAGELAYQQYLKELAGALPDFENAAYQRYSADGKEAYNRFYAYQNAENAAQQRYQDDLDRYYRILSYWSDVANRRSR